MGNSSPGFDSILLIIFNLILKTTDLCFCSNKKNYNLIPIMINNSCLITPLLLKKYRKNINQHKNDINKYI